jgi:hypothetical protein
LLNPLPEFTYNVTTIATNIDSTIIFPSLWNQTGKERKPGIHRKKGIKRIKSKDPRGWRIIIYYNYPQFY